MKFKIHYLLIIILFFYSCNSNKTKEKHSNKKDTISVKYKKSTEESDETRPKVNKFLTETYKFKIYHNLRFDFCVNYPSTILNPQGESENGDGQVFISNDMKFKMIVSGISNSENIDIIAAYEKDLNFHSSNPKNHLTLYRQAQNYYIISGYKGDNIFYSKSFLVKNKFYSIYFEYSQTDHIITDNLIKETLKTFPLCK
jgi:hypothetical protein